MRIQQLEYLEKIVEAGSINEAAKRLFLTQPSLSNAVKELENEMGIQIFQRSSGGISLTAEGREFMTYSKQILDQVNMMNERYKTDSSASSPFRFRTALCLRRSCICRTDQKRQCKRISIHSARNRNPKYFQ